MIEPAEKAINKATARRFLFIEVSFLTSMLWAQYEHHRRCADLLISYAWVLPGDHAGLAQS